MDARQKRLAVFEITSYTIKNSPRLQAAVAASREGQQIRWEEDPLPIPAARYDNPAQLRLTLKKTVEAAGPYARAGKKVCILNFASPVSPGGGVTKGSQAQEESICRVSTLYFALSHSETAGEFYDRHWAMIRAREMNRKNRDDVIYTPGIIAIRDDSNDETLLQEEEWYAMDVITCAAPDLRQIVFDKSQYSPGREELKTVLENRWRRILATAAEQGAEVLILGAFGCGVFACPPELVAETFRNVQQDYLHCFETIEFAVLAANREAPNYRAFRAIPGIREM